MDFFVGQIVLFAFRNAPQGFVFCQGQTLQAENYPTLYAVIGNQYGGSGQTFNLPNTTSINPMSGFQYAICVQGQFPSPNEGIKA